LSSKDGWVRLLVGAHRNGNGEASAVEFRAQLVGPLARGRLEISISTKMDGGDCGAANLSHPDFVRIEGDMPTDYSGNLLAQDRHKIGRVDPAEFVVEQDNAVVRALSVRI
jgi:hypothetical protein